MASVNLQKSNFSRKPFMKGRKFKSLHPSLYFFSVLCFHYVLSVEPDPSPKSQNKKMFFFCFVYLCLLMSVALEVLLGVLCQ